MVSTFSVLASVAILRSTVNDLVPEELRTYFWSFTRRFSSEIIITIKESHEGSTNRLFYAAVTYLDDLVCRALPQRLSVGKSEKLRSLMFGLERNSEIVDTFQGVQIKWTYYTDYNSAQQVETRWYEVKFHKMHAHMVKNKYLPHVLDTAKAFKDQNRIVRFHTVRHDRWSSSRVNLTHPMTFETLFMDGDLKEKVVRDLDRFIKGKEYYNKIGKVWKRGYLLYGPPGTGKSSLIAAMANYLNYDVYNLNLSAVHSDSGLENLLLHLPGRSILVVEDIDCCIKLQNRVSEEEPDSPKGPRVTLAGLLNAIDGLLSCCGDEKITVFTTNYRERIDPALLRPGRMDMHINLSYCTFSTFKQLAAAYLEIFNDDLFPQIEELIGKVKVSPAEVAGELMKAKSSKTSLKDFIKFLEDKESEEQSSVAPPITSNVDVNTPKAENGDNPTQKSGIQGQLANNKTAKLANGNASSNHNEVKQPAQMKGGEFAIKAELEPILEAIFAKHGDIAPITSNVDVNAPKAENGDNPTQKSGSQGQLANNKTAKLANGNASSNHNEVKQQAQIKGCEFAIKAELEPILEAIFAKHGDIAANTTLRSMQCRSSLLEIACGIIQKLQATKLENLTQVQVKSMLSEVQDLESVGLEVGWLHKRLVEIDEAVRLIELKAIISEKLSDTIFSNQQDTVISCDGMSLVGGLL